MTDKEDFEKQLKYICFPRLWSLRKLMVIKLFW